jgi:transposase
MNVLKPHLRISVETLLKNGIGQREIARKLNVNRRTIRRIALELGSKCSTRPPAFNGESEQSAPLAIEVATGFIGGLEAKPPTPLTGADGKTSQNVPPWPPAFIGENAPIIHETPAPSPSVRVTASACEAHREWITQQVRLGRNAVSVYQDLVDTFGFHNKYNSVKRFVGGLKLQAPERFDVLEYPPAEEAQVDYGQGAPTLTEKGKYKKPYLFVMTLKYSGKSFRKTVWRTSQEIWARLHEEAFRSFGGCPQYVVLDNLKEGVITPDLYEPKLNPVYAAMLDHYSVVADTCRVRDPNRKGTVESAIQHTQNALKGRQFLTIEEQNAHLRHWEERWASTRIHGRKKRQVMEMFLEEKPHLKPLPVEGFRMFKQGVRKVDDSGMVQIEGAYYAALPAALYSQVTVRVYEQEIEILDMTGEIVRRHNKATRKGAFVMNESDRIYNPSRQNALLLGKIDRIGANASALARTVFATQGRIGMKMINGLLTMARDQTCADIDDACRCVMASGRIHYSAIKQALKQRIEARARAPTPPVDLLQTAPEIRPLSDYQTFWENHSQTNREENDHADDHNRT